jgi:hypothetical protein
VRCSAASSRRTHTTGVARAGTVEGLQLDMAAELLAHAADLLADNRASYVQLRFLGIRMTETL